AAGYGLSARWADLDLALLAGEVRLHGLVVEARRAAEDAPPAGGPPPYVARDFAHVDVATSASWSGTIRIRRVAVDGLDVFVERREDGTIPLLEHFAGAGTDAPEPEAPAGDEPLTLDLGVQVDAVRLTHLRLHLLDRASGDAEPLVV